MPAGASTANNNLDWFGDRMKKKTNNKTIRIGFQNIGNLPKEQKNFKSRKLILYIVEKDFDIFGIAEVGLDWRKVDSNGQQKERVWDKFRLQKLVLAWNQIEGNKSTYQPRGTGIIAPNRIVARIGNTGTNQRNLGHWSWIEFVGREDKKFAVISTYWPCFTKGPSTVYQ